MAGALPNKSQTPPPPKRPVQAPKVRTPPRDPGRNRKILLGIVGATLLLAAVVAGFFLLSGDGEAEDSGVVATLREAGCTYENPPAQGRAHVSVLPPNFKPNSTPRSSGPHSAETLIYGSYRDVVPELNAVHNLEHGAVIVWFGPRVPQSTIDEINDFYNEDPKGLIVAQHPRLGDDVALVAWTRVARCQAFDADAAADFRDAFRSRGPEKFDLEAMQPGNA
jgi:hypothetical protein